jgi:hypothetical protein
MRRVALVSAILGLLIVADGIFQQVTRYNGGETQSVLNLSNVTLTDGWTLILSGVAVLVVSIIAFLLAGRGGQQSQTPTKVGSRKTAGT